MALAPGPIFFGSLLVSQQLRPRVHAEPATNTVEVALAPPASPSPAAAKPSNKLDVKCDRAGEELRAKLGDACRVLVRAPFVIGGDLNDDQLKSWYERTISPAARAMATSYFDTSPDEPMTVLLFSTEASYEHYAHELYGDEGISVFGYYKPSLRTLVMNIDTGGGTLVHELTHALMAFDFPGVPDWFNEGLASLHEQCRFRPDDAGIEGLVNWRLPLLQKTIAAGRLRSIEDLTESDDFRGPLEGVNYSQARYLCLYLQERGLLEDFYEQFRENRRRDPNGTATLAHVLGERPWKDVDAEFQEFVVKLAVE